MRVAASGAKSTFFSTNLVFWFMMTPPAGDVPSTVKRRGFPPRSGMLTLSPVMAATPWRRRAKWCRCLLFGQAVRRIDGGNNDGLRRSPADLVDGDAASQVDAGVLARKAVYADRLRAGRRDVPATRVTVVRAPAISTTSPRTAPSSFMSPAVRRAIPFATSSAIASTTLNFALGSIIFLSGKDLPLKHQMICLSYVNDFTIVNKKFKGGSKGVVKVGAERDKWHEIERTVC